MRRISCVSVALLCGALLGSVQAEAMECGSGFSRTEGLHSSFEHACYEYYFNNAGRTISAGNVVVFDVDGTGTNFITEGSEGPDGSQRSDYDTNGSDGDVTNFGTYIELIGVVDSGYVAGVVDEDTCADQAYCRIQVYGPRTVVCADESDAVGAGTLVGTSALAGQCGDSGASAEGALGVALEAGDGTNNDPIAVWIRPGSSP